MDVVIFVCIFRRRLCSHVVGPAVPHAEEQNVAAAARRGAAYAGRCRLPVPRRKPREREYIV